MTTKTKLADARVLNAVRKIVEYLAHDEELNWLGGKERNHVWHSVKIARDWLDEPKAADHSELNADISF